MVASHGVGTSSSLAYIPSLFTTGTLDTKDVDADGNPDDFYWHGYRVCRGRPKVFVELEGGYHMEPLEGKRLNFLTAKFLACHVQGRQDYCDYIYNGQLGNRTDLSYFEMDTTPYVPPPPPAPSPPVPPSPTPAPAPWPAPTPSPVPLGCRNFDTESTCESAGCQWCPGPRRMICKPSCFSTDLEIV